MNTWLGTAPAEVDVHPEDLLASFTYLVYSSEVFK